MQLTEEERLTCRIARIGASREVDILLDIIERLTGEKIEELRPSSVAKANWSQPPA